jgi:ribose transport system substrate-binding protein
MQLKSIQRAVRRLAVASLVCGVSHAAMAQGPEVVSGPGAEPDCFVPWSADTKYFQWPAKEGPYRIALANGFVGNTWRIQMIQTAKAFVAQPEIAEQISEFKVVSTGTDVAAQLAAIDNFIDSGYDAIVTIAVNPSAFGAVIRRANEAGVVLVPFDNVLDSDQVLQVNEDQYKMGQMMGDWLVRNIPADSGKLLEVRGVPGNSVDRDRHEGFRNVLESSGKNFEVVEVVGNWDDGTAQKATADAIAVHKEFDGAYTQGGSTGMIRAFMDAGHAFIPMSNEAENGARKLCAEHSGEGLKCSSAGQTPALVAIAIKAALTALKGEVVPQYVSVPIPYVEDPNFKDGENFYSDQTDNFFVANAFPACGVSFSASDIMSQTEADQ